METAVKCWNCGADEAELSVQGVPQSQKVCDYCYVTWTNEKLAATWKHWITRTVENPIRQPLTSRDGSYSPRASVQGDAVDAMKYAAVTAAVTFADTSKLKHEFEEKYPTVAAYWKQLAKKDLERSGVTSIVRGDAFKPREEPGSATFVKYEPNKLTLSLATPCPGDPLGHFWMMSPEGQTHCRGCQVKLSDVADLVARRGPGVNFAELPPPPKESHEEWSKRTFRENMLRQEQGPGIDSRPDNSVPFLLEDLLCADED